MMRDQRDLTGFEPADREEMVAVALRGEMLDRRALQPLEERVGGERRQHGLARPHLRAARAPAAAEMAQAHAGIEHCLRVGARRERGHRQRAADIGRVHPGMDRVLGGDHAAHRNGSGRRSGRTGVRHHGACDHRRDPHQLDHVALDRDHIRGLFRIFGADVEAMRQIAERTQL
jgi:hypothetical protein